MVLGMQRTAILCVVLIGSTGNATSASSVPPQVSAFHALPLRFPRFELQSSANSPDSPVTVAPSVKHEGNRLRRSKKCEVLNTTQSRLGLQELKLVPRPSLTFFVQPGSSFKRLVFRISLRNFMVHFNTEEAIDLHSNDLRHSGQDSWTRVRVKHYKYRQRGPDMHALHITAANTSLSLVSDSWWILNSYQGFVIYSEGEAQILFDCSPADRIGTESEEFISYDVWLLVGLMIVATVLLCALWIMWVHMRRQLTKKQAPLSFKQPPVYDEFDEEVMDRIRQKVESLRSGQSQSDLDTVVVSYGSLKGNHYVLEESREGKATELADHHYEVIENIYENTHVAKTSLGRTDVQALQKNVHLAKGKY